MAEELEEDGYLRDAAPKMHPGSYSAYLSKSEIAFWQQLKHKICFQHVEQASVLVMPCSSCVWNLSGGCTQPQEASESPHPTPPQAELGLYHYLFGLLVSSLRMALHVLCSSSREGSQLSWRWLRVQQSYWCLSRREYVTGIFLKDRTLPSLSQLVKALAFREAGRVCHALRRRIGEFSPWEELQPDSS